MNVEDLLLSKDIQYIPKGKDFVIRCLNPEHEDRNPSMRIDHVTGCLLNTSPTPRDS